MIVYSNYKYYIHGTYAVITSAYSSYSDYLKDFPLGNYMSLSYILSSIAWSIVIKWGPLQIEQTVVAFLETTCTTFFV